MSIRPTGRLLLPAILLGMQACWLYAWLSLIEARLLDSQALALMVVAFALAGALVYAYLRVLPLNAIVRMSCFWVLWFVLAALAGKLLLYPAMQWTQPDWILALPQALVFLIFESQPAELMILLGSACAWYLGGRTVWRGLTHGTLLSEFQFGLVLLLVAFLVARPLEVPTAHHIPIALSFFALSLAGVAITRSRREDTGASLLGRWHFLSSLGALLLAVSFLGLLATIAVTPALLAAILDGARYGLSLIGSALSFLLSLLPSQEFTPIEEPPPPAGDDSALREFYGTIPFPASLRRIMFIGWTVMVIGMVLFSLYRICGMVLDWLKRRSDSRGIEIESLDTGFLADLLALLFWCGRGIRKSAQAFVRFVRHGTQTTADMSWMSMYDALLRWTGKRLQVRASSQSVHEYQAALSRLLPAAAADLEYVTDTYARARYGGHEPEREALNQMSEAVQRIRKAPRGRRPIITDPQMEGNV